MLAAFPRLCLVYENTRGNTTASRGHVRNCNILSWRLMVPTLSEAPHTPLLHWRTMCGVSTTRAALRTSTARRINQLILAARAEGVSHVPGGRM